MKAVVITPITFYFSYFAHQTLQACQISSTISLLLINYLLSTTTTLETKMILVIYMLMCITWVTHFIKGRLIEVLS